MTESGKELRKFIRENLPIAFAGNPMNEFSEEDYRLSEKLLKPFVSRLINLDRLIVVQTFAALIRAINNNWDVSRVMDRDSFKERGEEWKVYGKMIPEFKRAMDSLSFKAYRGGGLFPITKVIFMGAEKNDKIELEGPILNILRQLFLSFRGYHTDESKRRMRDFSQPLYDAYEEYILESSILKADDGTIAKKLIKSRENTSLNTAINSFRNQIAYYIHIFLKKYDNSKTKIPEWHKQFIGELFISCGIAHNGKEMTEGFVGDSYNSVRRWIEEGEKTIK